MLAIHLEILVRYLVRINQKQLLKNRILFLAPTRKEIQMQLNQSLVFYLT